MHILNKLALVATAFLAGTGQASAQADCQPRFVDRSVSISISGVEVGLNEQVIENFNIRVRNEGTVGRCSAYLQVAQNNVLALTTPLDFRLRSGGTQVQILANESTPGGTGGDLFIAGLPSGSNGRAVPFQLGFPTPWGLQEGSFTRELVFTLLGPDGEQFDQMLVAVRVLIPATVALRIVGATGSGPMKRVELGNLDADALTQSPPFGLRVWSTSPYRVEFASDNLGNLRRVAGSDEVPYALLMNDLAVNLRSTNVREFSKGTDAMGDFHSLRVTVEPTFARAGRYMDRVVVTVSAI